MNFSAGIIQPGLVATAITLVDLRWRALAKFDPADTGRPHVGDDDGTRRPWVEGGAPGVSRGSAVRTGLRRRRHTHELARLRQVTPYMSAGALRIPTLKSVAQIKVVNQQVALVDVLSCSSRSPCTSRPTRGWWEEAPLQVLGSHLRLAQALVRFSVTMASMDFSWVSPSVPAAVHLRPLPTGAANGPCGSISPLHVTAARH